MASVLVYPRQVSIELKMQPVLLTWLYRSVFFFSDSNVNVLLYYAWRSSLETIFLVKLCLPFGVDLPD